MTMTDEELYEAALLAQVLTDQNFITRRYDKRASGPHVRENMPRLLGKISLQSHREELAGGVRLLASYDAAMADFAAERPVTIDENMPETLRMVIGAVTAPHNLPFARELWVTDPIQLAASITVPLLVIIGQKDMQVDWQVDGSRWETLAKERNNITLVYPDNANHVLKYEPKPKEQLTPAEITNSYSAEDTILDSQVVEIVTAWLNTQR